MFDGEARSAGRILRGFRFERQKRRPSSWILAGTSGDERYPPSVSARFQALQRWPVSLGIRHAAYLWYFFLFFFSFYEDPCCSIERHPRRAVVPTAFVSNRDRSDIRSTEPKMISCFERNPRMTVRTESTGTTGTVTQIFIFERKLNPVVSVYDTVLF